MNTVNSKQRNKLKYANIILVFTLETNISTLYFIENE